MRDERGAQKMAVIEFPCGCARLAATGDTISLCPEHWQEREAAKMEEQTKAAEKSEAEKAADLDWTTIKDKDLQALSCGAVKDKPETPKPKKGLCRRTWDCCTAFLCRVLFVPILLAASAFAAGLVSAVMIGLSGAVVTIGAVAAAVFGVALPGLVLVGGAFFSLFTIFAPSGFVQEFIAECRKAGKK